MKWIQKEAETDMPLTIDEIIENFSFIDDWKSAIAMSSSLGASWKTCRKKP